MNHRAKIKALKFFRKVKFIDQMVNLLNKNRKKPIYRFKKS